MLLFLRFSALERTAQQCLISVSQSAAARPGNDWLTSFLVALSCSSEKWNLGSVGTKRRAVTTLRISPDEGLFVTRRPGTAGEMPRNDYGRSEASLPRRTLPGTDAIRSTRKTQTVPASSHSFSPARASTDDARQPGSLPLRVLCVPGRDSTSGYKGPAAPSKTGTSCVGRPVSCDGSRQLHIFQLDPPSKVSKLRVCFGPSAPSLSPQGREKKRSARSGFSLASLSIAVHRRPRDRQGRLDRGPAG